MPNINHFGVEDGQNAWIAEIGDDNVSLSEQETGNFRLFPNPAGNILYVSSVQKIQINEIQIFNISGNLILKQKIETNFRDQEIDLKNIPSGLYLINIQTKNGKHENFKINIAR